MNFHTVLLVISINQLVAFAQYQGENDYNHVAPGVPPQAYNPPTQQEEVKFHDPSEFAQNDNQQQVNSGHSHQTNHGHDDHRHGIGESVDKEHMKQHEQDDYVDFSKMSESEVIMHHFKQFDHDKDGKLDGLEVLKQIQRQNEDHNDKNPNDAVKKSTNTDQLVSETVDQSLQTYDEDNDGYINYGEFYRTHIRLTQDMKNKDDKES